MTNVTRRADEPRKSDEELAALLIRLATDPELLARYLADRKGTIDKEYPNMDPASREALIHPDPAVIRQRLALSNQSSESSS